MKAMVIEGITNFADNPEPLRLVHLPLPKPGENKILLRVSVCGVCHTEIDEIEGRTPLPYFL